MQNASCSSIISPWTNTPVRSSSPAVNIGNTHTHTHTQTHAHTPGRAEQGQRVNEMVSDHYKNCSSLQRASLNRWNMTALFNAEVWKRHKRCFTSLTPTILLPASTQAEKVPSTAENEPWYPVSAERLDHAVELHLKSI